MKRLLSIFIAVIMVAAMVLPTTAVFADEEVAFDPFAGDHVKGEMPANLIINPSSAMWTTGKNDGQIDLASINWKNANTSIGWEGGYMGAKIYTTNGVSTVSSHLNSAGFGLQDMFIDKDPSTYVLGETYVFMFAFRNINPEVPASLVVGDWNGTYSGVVTKDFIPVPEYEGGVIEAPQSGEWVTFKGTVSTRATTPDKSSVKPYVKIGLPKGTAAGAAVEFNALHDGVLQPYYAKEVPHYITLEPVADAAVIKGLPTSYKAKLLNQVDSVGYLAQNFTYTVFGADGEAVEGLTVSEDGVVSATDAVADGTYYLRATTAIDADTTWQKTLAFNVIGAIENTDDYVAKNLNAIGNPADATNYNQFNVTNQVIAPVTTTPGVYIWNVKTATTAGAYHTGYLAGAIFKTSGGNYIDSDFKILTGEKLVLKMAVKNVGTTDSVKVNASLSNNVTWSTAKFSEEYGAEGALVTSKDDWTILQFTLTMPGKTGVEYNPRLAFGFPEGTPVGSAVAINLDTPGVPKTFVGKYEPSDISVTGASSTVEVGKSLDLAAQVFNSEFEGEFKQSFDWVAVNTARTRYIDGITFTPSNDGANVKVNVADTVAPGEYLIVAQNADYGMNRQYPITVTAPTYDVTEFTLNTDSDTAVLEALTVNTVKTVKVVIAAFAGNKVVTSNKTEITPVDGVAALADPLAISGLSAGDKVRVFVWDTLLAPFSMKNAWKTPITIE